VRVGSEVSDERVVFAGAAVVSDWCVAAPAFHGVRGEPEMDGAAIASARHDLVQSSRSDWVAAETFVGSRTGGKADAMRARIGLVAEVRSISICSGGLGTPALG